MPTYEYRCPKGHTFEMFQRMSDAPAETCEVCGEGPVEKILFPVAVHFKGSGFYNTDYGKSRKVAADSDGGSGGSTDKSDTSDKKDTGAASSEKSSGGSDSSSGSSSGSSGSTSSSD